MLLKLQVLNIIHKSCFSAYKTQLLSALHNAVYMWLCVIVGYAWLPLLKDGRLSSQEFSIPVSCTLPGGYLLIKEPTSTKVSRITELQVDIKAGVFLFYFLTFCVYVFLCRMAQR